MVAIRAIRFVNLLFRQLPALGLRNEPPLFSPLPLHILGLDEQDHLPGLRQVVPEAQELDAV